MLRNRVPIFINKTKNLCTAAGNDQINPIFTNRNPRNLERLHYGYKPTGYHLEKLGKCYWHKLELTTTSRHVTATVKHFENGEVLKASTKEWALQKHLYRTQDATAYINLGRVLAQRCLESGITEIQSYIKADNPDGKIGLFLKMLEEGGVLLEEAEQYKKPAPWNTNIPRYKKTYDNKE